ncbi:MAG: 30S ribosomal protein S12 methylthiotransferase RimO [Bacteroidales bacterium]|nr:30S ribosomal protein S12 methylthiotransferase RimO [Bacteroidales bacterium]
MTLKINIITLGCSKNIADSEHVAGHLKKAGFQLFFDRSRNDCDIVIVNTCGFIGDAKEESVNTLLEQIEIKRRSRKTHKLIAIGCLIERYRKELQDELPEIDAFYGVHQWGELVRSLEAEYHDTLESERMQSTPKHYAYLKISEGCNRSCSYCAIPLIRGKHVSRPIDDIIAEAKDMVSNGVKELIVIAQDTTYYGLDIYGERRLGTLLNRLAEESGAEWIRLHYTYPASFPADAIEAIAKHDNICKYIDIPLQHINSRILASMQRGIDREGTLDLFDHFRRDIPNVAIRTTLIVGYPGETEEEFEELKEFVRKARFSRMGVFAYSPEEGTAAFALADTVSEEEKQRRVDELMTIQEQIALENNEAFVGKELRVLVDRCEGDYWICRSEYDSPDVDNEVLVPAKAPMCRGNFYTVRIVDAMEHDLMAEYME